MVGFVESGGSERTRPFLLRANLNLKNENLLPTFVLSQNKWILVCIKVSSAILVSPLSRFLLNLVENENVSENVVESADVCATQPGSTIIFSLNSNPDLSRIPTSHGYHYPLRCFSYQNPALSESCTLLSSCPLLGRAQVLVPESAYAKAKAKANSKVVKVVIILKVLLGVFPKICVEIVTSNVSRTTSCTATWTLLNASLPQTCSEQLRTLPAFVIILVIVTVGQDNGYIVILHKVCVENVPGSCSPTCTTLTCTPTTCNQNVNPNVKKIVHEKILFNVNQHLKRKAGQNVSRLSAVKCASYLTKTTKVANVTKATKFLLSTFLVFFPALYKDSRQRERVLKLDIATSGDVESNPGPHPNNKSELTVATYNVRGLGDEKKLRHLVNYIYKMDRGKNSDLIFCMQETYIESPGIIPYLWRGNYVLTPGSGHSCGCITLLSAHLNVIRSTNLDDRAHVFAIQRAGDTNCSYIIANVYAPNPNNDTKLDFFERLFETITEYEELLNCSTVIVLGDFNLNFQDKEVKNRFYSMQEKRLAEAVKNMYGELELTDVWETSHRFTWKRANTDVFSTIDRILFTKETLTKQNCDTQWSISKSDHAAVIVGFNHNKGTASNKDRIVRLDSTLAKDPVYGPKIIVEYEIMLEQIPTHWNPHMKLEYAKVCLRSVVEKVQAERKRKEKQAEDFIDDELNAATELLEKATSMNGNLITRIEELRNEKARLIEKKGERLAEKLGTKWYNEGEKSTKYFLRLLNRSMPDEVKLLKGENGEEIREAREIEELIVNYYKNLYETFNDLEQPDDEEFFNLIDPIDGVQDAEIVKAITPEELRKTLHETNDSAPGPDGIPYSLLGLVWNTFGTILCEAWNYSLQTRELPLSHRISYLRLIPKAGKDLTLLTNWRPISLSNCDHKLITKTYAKRLCERVSSKISESQTAYIKGRMINDNIRSMIATLTLANVEETAKGLIIALDAKKAFDSVSHKYIEKCLNKFGCKRFVEIFKVLYKGLNTDILINGRIVKGFSVKRGVKQGDALSCIIFIMCMEPLLRNIEANEEIRPLESQILNTPLPKVYGYADDLNLTVKCEVNTVQEVFKEYERLTKQSGLELNADKTEIMKIGGNERQSIFHFTYLGVEVEISSIDKVKINGIYFQNNQDLMADENVNNAVKRMDAHFKSWSRRALSTLGKILICKTFGISQIIYLMQSLMLNEKHFKQINSILFKFIWNRHYLAAKAPERVRRDIVCKNVKNGGFGMLDVAAIDKSLKLRMFCRTVSSNHPFLAILKGKIQLDFFYPKCQTNVDKTLNVSIEVLKKERGKLWGLTELDNNVDILNAVRNCKIAEIISGQGRLSLPYFAIWARGKRLIGDLTVDELRSLFHYVDNVKHEKLEKAVRFNLPHRPRENVDISKCVLLKGKIVNLETCSSKAIREMILEEKVITTFKVGLTLNERLSANWLYRVNKLQSTQHKCTLLRIAHGEVYTQERLARFGLVDSALCSRCDQVEDLNHKIADCVYVRKIWEVFIRALNLNETYDKLELIMGIRTDHEFLCLHAEILLRILRIPRESNFLIHPKHFVRLACKKVSICEKRNDTKQAIQDVMLRL